MKSNSEMLIHELNERAWLVGEQVQTLAKEMDVRVFEDASGATVLDFGVDRNGTIAGGIALAMTCMADLADVQILSSPDSELPLPQIQVFTDHPLLACVASQYAGWKLTLDGYFSMCSGPARMARGQEAMLTEYNLEHSMDRVVGILEADQLPDSKVLQHFAEECCVEPSEVLICIARTASIPGSLQVVARSIETTMHKLHEIGFDLRKVENAVGTAPLPPIPADSMTALGWTNDSILYGANVVLWVDESDEEIEKSLRNLPSNTSPDFGTPFVEIFRRYNGDFYQIDKMLFSPARVVVNSTRTGSVSVFGEIRNDILLRSFGLEK